MNEYVRVPMRKESRDKLKRIIEILKTKYGMFVGYDEAIEELVRNIQQNDEFVRTQMKLSENNRLQIRYRNVITGGVKI